MLNYTASFICDNCGTVNAVKNSEWLVPIHLEDSQGNQHFTERLACLNCRHPEGVLAAQKFVLAGSPKEIIFEKPF